jgi:2,4-dienoyl-CoA reductase-like NADH-dependent reductase (Old Yellow Enzyme family)
MSRLQDALVVRGISIKNRIVMEPMYTFSFEGGSGCFYTRQHIDHYEARARGGAGLIILQATQCAGASNGTGQWTPGDITVLKTIAQKCHNYGATVMMQLACGDTDINSLTPADIRAMQHDMISAAVTACELGFDGAEFHCAHGFTLCKFLDAKYNQRTAINGADAIYGDGEFGGAAVNRARIVTGILPEIRSKTGEKFILCVRMGEFLPESRDGVELAQVFENAGIDLLNISFGMTMPEGPVPEGFIGSPMAYSGCRIKQAVEDMPVIAAGGIRTEEQARFLIENDYADLAGVGTAFLADPAFANRIMNGTPVNKCRGCARCAWFSDHTKCPVRQGS